MTAQEINITPQSQSFSHGDACRVFDLALRCSNARTIVIDLKHAVDATTSAFARLVLLRRELLHLGRDLCLAGLRARAADVYNVNRLATVLPMR